MVESSENDSSSTASAQPGAAPTRAPVRETRWHAWSNPWLVVALVVIGLAVWQGFETRSRLADTQQRVTRRLAESDAQSQEARVLAKQSQEELAALQAKLGELEGQLAESKNQQATLEKLYQELAHNRDDWALAEVEQGVTLASQQLQLAANVPGALLALETAEARLAGSDKPQFASIRQHLAHDLDRLRALPQIDIAAMSARLESVIGAIDRLPLAVHGRPRAENEATMTPSNENARSPASLAYWREVGASFWREMRGLVRIQRFDREEPALLAPGQEFFLRENFKLRLLNARLALLAHDQWTYRSELRMAQSWVDRYFDNREVSVQSVRDNLNQLSATEISIALPNLNESLSAIKMIRAASEKR